IVCSQGTPFSRSASSGTVISASTSVLDRPSASVLTTSLMGENSGTTSTGTLRMCHTPATARMAANVTTSVRRRRLSSIAECIMRSPLLGLPVPVPFPASPSCRAVGGRRCGAPVDVPAAGGCALLQRQRLGPDRGHLARIELLDTRQFQHFLRLVGAAHPADLDVADAGCVVLELRGPALAFLFRALPEQI